jgi:hypothetical protein
MNSQELQACVNRCPPAVRNAFSGIFYFGDNKNIFKPPNYPSCFILYMPYNARCGHWIAGIVLSRAQCEIFNSIGGLNPSLKSWLFRIKPRTMRLRWNSVCVQPQASSLCGLYCIFYLIHRLHKRLSFWTLFDHVFHPAPTLQNDLNVLQIRRQLFTV